MLITYLYLIHNIYVLVLVCIVFLRIMFEETIDFWKVNLPKMTIIYFINWIVAEEKCLREESIRENAVCLMKNIFLTFGDLLTSFLVKNADSRWWIGKSPIGNRTTLVRGCGVDIPYARMKNWKEGEERVKKTTMFWITKTVCIVAD